MCGELYTSDILRIYGVLDLADGFTCSCGSFDRKISVLIRQDAMLLMSGSGRNATQAVLRPLLHSG